jgi:hypothetical protein
MGLPKGYELPTGEIIDVCKDCKKVLKEIDLSKIHNCEKCQGKIVCISVDSTGISRCSYCNEVVDYNKFIKQEIINEKQKRLMRR